MNQNHERHLGNYDYSNKTAEKAKPAGQAKESEKVLYFAEPLTGRSSAEVLQRSRRS